MKPFPIDALGNLHAQLGAFVVPGEANPLSHTAPGGSVAGLLVLPQATP